MRIRLKFTLITGIVLIGGLVFILSLVENKRSFDLPDLKLLSRGLRSADGMRREQLIQYSEELRNILDEQLKRDGRLTRRGHETEVKLSHVNSCQFEPCANGASCFHDEGNSFTCVCAAGWTGKTCETRTVNICQLNPCANGARCFQGERNSFMCVCAEGWTGKTCGTKKGNPCQFNPCANGASCFRGDEGTSFTCSCTYGWTGKTCAERATRAGYPPTEYEHIRRKIDNSVTELWYYMSAQLNKLMKDLPQEKKREVGLVLVNAGDHKRSILTDIYNLSRHDNYDGWRRLESANLKESVQRRLYHLQNPKNCSEAKKLVCGISRTCGFGCSAHQVAYCLLVAYATNRTLILSTNTWEYSSKGWGAVFQPLSGACTNVDGKDVIIKSADPRTPAFREAQVAELVIPFPDDIRDGLNFIPPAIPVDLSERLIRIHGYPFVWWFGQILTYVMRPNGAMAYQLELAKQRLGFQHPIVGVHVRRTDKLTAEAAFHAIEEYMIHVEEFYLRLWRGEKFVVKRVYLATDDDNLLEEAKRKYPSYKFISDINITRSAADTSTRYSELSLKGIVTDVILLAQCDYIVCTLSSTACRTSYALMQDRHVDASSYIHSLDDVYWLSGQNGHDQVALYNHQAQNEDEISFQAGDLISVAGNHWDGYSKGANRRLGDKMGLYPSYKVGDRVDIGKMPMAYEEVN